MCNDSKDQPPTLAGWALIAAYSAAVFAGGHFASPYITISGDKGKYNLPLAENTYQRPEELRVRLVPDKGTLRTYLIDAESGDQVEIRKDMRPPAADMAKTGYSRVTKKIDEWLPKGSRQALEGMVAEYITGS